MNKGKTTLIQIDPLEGVVPTKYKPIMCLSIMWKTLTQIMEKIYNSLISRGIFPDEQKGCRKRTRSTEDLLYIDQHILNKSKTRRKNLAMAWIDYKKANDMVPQSWILHCLKMYKIPDQVVQFIEKSQEKINRLMYMDDIKLFAKNAKKIGNPNTNCENMQSR